MKNLVIILISLIMFSCGFKPIYKMSETEKNLMNFEVSFQNPNQVSRVIMDEVKGVLSTDTDANFMIIMNVEEDHVPLIINTNGTVAKYRISVILNFLLKKIDSDELILEDSARGHSQYDVGTSEIENEDKKIQMTMSATSDATQIMMSKILSSINNLNDN